eukprot:TRINITY_DN2717_c0_g1_i18.p1 TRINITY_DN2717_c0_g1~~TRINITY_DN2717_c0_g1_i18.p1  ORF type:complete len:112 (-),score=6.58 TRINITY_DN2717_c0_g1_i18:132-467(-)
MESSEPIRGPAARSELGLGSAPRSLQRGGMVGRQRLLGPQLLQCVLEHPPAPNTEPHRVPVLVSELLQHLHAHDSLALELRDFLGDGALIEPAILEAVSYTHLTLPTKRIV